MIRKATAIGLGLMLTVTGQSAVLGHMVYERVALLRTGQEISLAMAPRDPRSLFRGYYARLTYKISNINLRDVEGADTFKRKSAIYVILAPDDTGAWTPVSVHPSPMPAAAGQAMVRGTVKYMNGSQATVRVNYGIESYFLPRAEARRIERLPIADMRVRAAVGPDGTVAIKGILVDGKLEYAEPPF